MQGKDITKSTFFQLFQPILCEKIFQLINNAGVDKYIKKLTAIKLFYLLAYAQLEQLKGLRDISNSLNNDLQSICIDLDSISHSQISRRLNTLPVSVFKTIFQDLTWQIGKKVGFQKIRNSLGRIYLIDASVISLCLSRYRWAEFRKEKGGIKLHLRLNLFGQGVLPDCATITTAKHSDKTEMDNLIVEEKDAINIFDRGYVDYKKFDHYCDKGIGFVTRLKSNAVVYVQKELPLSPASEISRDYVAILGWGSSRMKHPVRLIETTDTEGNQITIVTNVFEKNAEEIGQLYRYRWQIEIFFKWLKQHLHVKHLYGLSQQAVENQLYIALATYCLLKMIQINTGCEGPLLTVKRLVCACIYEPYEVFRKKLSKQKKRTSNGRRRLNYEVIYELTVRQVMDGETDFLNELSYDPIVL